MRCYFLSTSQHHRVQTHHHKTVCILYYQGCKGSVRQIQICCPSSSENVSNIQRFGYICMLFCRFSEVLGDCCFLGHLDEDTFKGLSSHPEYTDSWQLYLVFYGPVQQYLRWQHFGEKSVESPKSVGFFAHAATVNSQQHFLCWGSTWTCQLSQEWAVVLTFKMQLQDCSCTDNK